MDLFLTISQGVAMIRGSSEYMCKITVSYDSAKRDEVKKILKKEGMTIQDAMRL